MKGNPWTKLILVSLSGIIIGLALLLSLQQINRYTYYNTYRMQGGMSVITQQQAMNMQMDGSINMSGMMEGME